MNRNWTFGQKVAGGFALGVLLTLAVGALAVYALRLVVSSKDRVLAANVPSMIAAERLQLHAESKAVAARGFLLTRDERMVQEMQQARAEFPATIENLRQTVEGEEGRRLLGAIDRAEADHQSALDRVIALRRTEATIEAVSRLFDEAVLPKRQALVTQLEAFAAREQRLLDSATRAASETASATISLVVGLMAAAGILSIVLALVLTRSLGRQIGSAVGQIQSSSAELQTAANQQVTGTREQVTSMSEITTTISELLATSRQIAESAQRVAQIAGQTTGAARAGEGKLDRAQESLASIRRQVDVVVGHMLDLGRKSQQIGGILEIVTELAEQTNILAINATIEAAGAGESGRRFAVVADEIRKLADRVAGSAKQIRELIDEVRGAVNTAVMATEGGSKAVDAGTRQFGEAAEAFRQIVELVGTTTEAAREIELSTKQQATAVEQVNIAISNVAQATKETEASSSQTLQTAGQLTGLSRDLLRLVRPQVAV